MTRAEHLRWAKDRAIEIANAGDCVGALTSFVSDLGKHDETRWSVAVVGQLGMGLVAIGDLRTPVTMIAFIEGTN
jgi:hypothetical protein